MSLPANGTPVSDLAIPVAIRATATGDPRVVRVVVPISDATVRAAVAAAAALIAALDVDDIAGLRAELDAAARRAQAEAFITALVFG